MGRWKLNEMNNIKEKPLVSILMAGYKPNKDWLVEQLQSLNVQDYENLELIVWDDCPDHPVEESYFETHITNFEYTLIRGVWNLGSNGAFEELTKRANGDYICYCDQDDIWNANKIRVMLDKILETKAALVCCDQYIIDEHGNKTADSITEIRKRHVFRSGIGLTKYLIADNFVTGCALIMPTEIARKAIPFEPSYVHDQWLAIVASMEGSIEVIREPLIGYRQHSNNQTGILTGVVDKQTYYEWRIEYFLKRAEAVKKRLEELEDVNKEVVEAVEAYESWILARQRFWRKKNLKDYKMVRAGKTFSKVTVLLESFMLFIPDCLFKKMVRLAKKGVL